MNVERMLLQAQENEITEYFVYNQLAKFADKKNAKVLRKIAEEEMKHYQWFKKKTGRELNDRTYDGMPAIKGAACIRAVA